ncbi:rRNA biogenesis protein rrp36 [Ceratobasidium sp. UAMH 11750]|nr:rRNA biogenesis protein rrp36 [Ceratobasidium sp. UAMH 11750]
MPRRPRPASRPPPRSKRPHPDEEDEVDDIREDRPRFAQWVPEDELDPSGSGSSSRSQSGPDDDSDPDSVSESNSGSDTDSDAPVAESSKSAKPEWATAKRKKDIDKRSSKHAPTEVTSKRPVSRHRTVVDVQKNVSRDPRFTSVSGELSRSHFANAYSFLPELQKSEAATLRASLAKARKQRAAPETIDKLERALKRAESAVEHAKREEREQEVLAKAKKEEKAKREEGKGAWFLKKSEKRKLLLQAKFDDLAASGGQNAVRKAIDKRKKKLAQKEKKARPFSKAQARASTQSQNRAEGSGGDRKRRRM